jgi:hypothetical protein
MKQNSKHSPFKYTLNSPEGNSPEVLSHAVAELLVVYKIVHVRELCHAGWSNSAMKEIWCGRAAYVINHLFGNQVSMNTNAYILFQYLHKALADGKVQPFTGTI